MESNKEINALFTLIDDPDEEVFGAVSSRIIDYGKGIIPNLEDLWENTTSENIQQRIEMLIHRLHFRDLSEEFDLWNRNVHQDLLSGALLVARFEYPDLNAASIYQDIEKLRRNIWLELNTFLTPLEQVNVLSSILYNYFNLRGTEISPFQPGEYLINKQLESKKGNALANLVLYLIMCDLLDIPVRAIGIPKQYVMGYFKNDYNFEHPEDVHYTAEFFIDPLSGQLFSHKDLNNYFERINVESQPSFFVPLSNREIIQNLLIEYSLCFHQEKDEYKGKELRAIAAGLQPPEI